MKSVKDLRDILDETIENNDINLNYINELMLRFTKKGFSGLRIINLFDNEEGSVTVDTLDEVELAGIATELYDLTKEQKWNPVNYMLSNLVRENYEKGQIKDEVSEDTFELNNVYKVSDNAYLCPVWDLRDIYEARKKGQIRYNFNTQRQAKFITNKRGKVKKIATINKESVDEIAKNLLEGTYGVPDMLTLNVPIYREKNPNFSFENGKLSIKINPNFDDSDFTVIDSVDGEHRQLAVMKAMIEAKKEHKELHGSFPVMITLQTIEEARNFISRKAKGNPINRDYTRAIESNDYTELIESINNTAGLLQNNIALTYEDMKLENKLTHRNVLVEALKFNDIDVSKITERTMMKKKILEVLKFVDETIDSSDFINDKDKYLSTNIFAAYITLAAYCRKNNKSDDFILEVFFAIHEKIDIINTKLSLKSKLNEKIISVCEFFERLFEELDK